VKEEERRGMGKEEGRREKMRGREFWGECEKWKQRGEEERCKRIGEGRTEETGGGVRGGEKGENGKETERIGRR
jgi:hypothetical protein